MSEQTEQAPGPVEPQTQGSALEELAKLKADPEFRAHLTGNSGNFESSRQAQERWRNLSKLAYGEQQTDGQPGEPTPADDAYLDIRFQYTDGMDRESIANGLEDAREISKSIGLPPNDAKDAIQVLEQAVINRGGGPAADPEGVAIETETLLRDAWGDAFDAKLAKAMGKINQAGDRKQVAIQYLLAAGPNAYAWALRRLADT